MLRTKPPGIGGDVNRPVPEGCPALYFPYSPPLYLFYWYKSTNADRPVAQSVPEASTWLALARKALSGCLSDEMVMELESEGLVDCSQVSQSPTGTTSASVFVLWY